MSVLLYNFSKNVFDFNCSFKVRTARKYFNAKLVTEILVLRIENVPNGFILRFLPFYRHIPISPHVLIMTLCRLAQLCLIFVVVVLGSLKLSCLLARIFRQLVLSSSDQPPFDVGRVYHFAVLAAGRAVFGGVFLAAHVLFPDSDPEDDPDPEDVSEEFEAWVEAFIEQQLELEEQQGHLEVWEEWVEAFIEQQLELEEQQGHLEVWEEWVDPEP